MNIRYRINKLQQSVFTDVAYSYVNLLEQKKTFLHKKRFNYTGLVWKNKMAAVSLL